MLAYRTEMTSDLEAKKAEKGVEDERVGRRTSALRRRRRTLGQARILQLPMGTKTSIACCKAMLPMPIRTSIIQNPVQLHR